MSNIEIKQLAKQNNIFLYEIAKELNSNDGNLSKKLRYEFSKEEKERIFKIIEKIKKEKE